MLHLRNWLVLAVVLGMCPAVPAAALAAPVIPEGAAKGGYAVSVKGTEMVPLCPVIEWLGGRVREGAMIVRTGVKDKESIVTATLTVVTAGGGALYEDKYAEFTVGATTAAAFGKDVKLGGKVLQPYGYTYVPARGLAEAINTTSPYGVTVEWDDAKHQVIFHDKTWGKTPELAFDDWAAGEALRNLQPAPAPSEAILSKLAAECGCTVVVNGMLTVPCVEVKGGQSVFVQTPCQANNIALVPLRPVIEWLGGSIEAMDPAGRRLEATLPTAGTPAKTLTLEFGVGERSASNSVADLMTVASLDFPILQVAGVTYVSANGLADLLNAYTHLVSVGWKRIGDWGDTYEVVFRKDGTATQDLTFNVWPDTGGLAMIVTARGDILIHFCDDAPATVTHFATLMNRGFYDGLTFTHVETGAGSRYIQGGYPEGKEPGAPGYVAKREHNRLTHTEGAVAMVCGVDPETTGSSFYICTGAMPQRDGKDAVFGYVIEGMDVARRIVEGDKITLVFLATVTKMRFDNGPETDGLMESLFSRPVPQATALIPTEAAHGGYAVVVKGTIKVPKYENCPFDPPAPRDPSDDTIGVEQIWPPIFSETTVTVPDTALVPLWPVIKWLGGSLQVNDDEVCARVQIPAGAAKDQVLIFATGECHAFLGTVTPAINGVNQRPNFWATNEMALPVVESAGVSYVMARGLADALDRLGGPPYGTVAWDGKAQQVVFHKDGATPPDFSISVWNRSSAEH